MRLAHISDLHVLDLKGIKPWRFLNKRVTGGLNLLLGRSKIHRPELLELALAKIEALGCDHIAVTGDVSNLALESEFRRVKELLAGPIAAHKLSVVAGNHDRYTLGSVLTRRFDVAFEALIQTDLPLLPSVHGWPYVKLLGDVALIGLNTAVAQPIAVSGGRVGHKQLEALQHVLKHPDVEARYSVVMMHHHMFKPANKKREFPRGLSDRKEVLEVLLEGKADLVIHGHNHYYSTRTHPRSSNGSGVMVVCEAGSTTIARAHKDPNRDGKFNTYDIEHGRLSQVTTYRFVSGPGFVPWRRWGFDNRTPIRLPLALEQ